MIQLKLRLVSLSYGEILAGFKNRKKYFEEKGLEMLTIEENLVDLVWATGKPSIPQDKVFVLDVKYAGETVQQKIAKIDAKLATKKVDVLLVTTLDDIDWITNLRGNDILCNPVFFSYLIFHGSKGD